MPPKNFIKALLVVAWVIVQIYFFQTLGVKVVYDSHRYIRAAEHILTTFTLPTGHDARYAGYSLFLACILGMGGSLNTVIGCQVLLAGVAGWAFYVTAKQLLRQEIPALLAASGMVFFVELSQWNMYILTESLFISTGIFSFYFLIRLQKWWHFCVYLPLLLFIATIRPNGFIFSVATISYLFVKLWQQYTSYRSTFIIGAGFLLGIILITINNYLLFTFQITEVYQRGDIIFGYRGLLVKPATAPTFTSATSSFGKITWYLLNNPEYFLKAGALKLFYFFTHIKPYYTWVHNSFSVVFLLPVYCLAFRVRNLNNATLAFIGCVVGLQAAMVFFTTEDWDGRFLMPVLPFIFLLSAAGTTFKFKLISHPPRVTGSS